MIEQVLDEQTAVENAPVGHERKHAPQLEGSAVVGVSQPSALLPLQFAKPGLQLTIVHRPSPQPAVALARLHAAPQVPQ